jgi:hypothetical protein
LSLACIRLSEMILPRRLRRFCCVASCRRARIPRRIIAARHRCSPRATLALSWACCVPTPVEASILNTHWDRHTYSHSHTHAHTHREHSRKARHNKQDVSRISAPSDQASLAIISKRHSEQLHSLRRMVAYCICIRLSTTVQLGLQR